MTLTGCQPELRTLKTPFRNICSKDTRIPKINLASRIGFRYLEQTYLKGCRKSIDAGENTGFGSFLLFCEVSVIVSYAVDRHGHLCFFGAFFHERIHGMGMYGDQQRGMMPKILEQGRFVLYSSI